MASGHQTLPECEVAAGAVIDSQGRVLIARRPDHVHQGGFWEFPGGKLEPGETARQALDRELHEELDIQVTAASPLITLQHDYPDRRIRLHVWKVEAFAGIARGKLGQPIRWVEKHELTGYTFPEANQPIVAAVLLPDRYAILDIQDDDPGKLLQTLNGYVSRNIRLIRLRGNRLTSGQYRQVAAAASEFCRNNGIGLMLSGEAGQVSELGAAGLHLRSDQLMSLSARPLGRGYRLAASCHDAAQLEQAARIGADFAVLGPVSRTASHPAATPIGWDSFARLVRSARLPVYALGGLGEHDLSHAITHGGQGIAAIRAFRD